MKKSLEQELRDEIEALKKEVIEHKASHEYYRTKSSFESGVIDRQGNEILELKNKLENISINRRVIKFAESEGDYKLYSKDFISKQKDEIESLNIKVANLTAENDNHKLFAKNYKDVIDVQRKEISDLENKLKLKNIGFKDLDIDNVKEINIIFK